MSLYKLLQFSPELFKEEINLIEECLFQLGLDKEDEGSYQILCHYLDLYVEMYFAHSQYL